MEPKKEDEDDMFSTVRSPNPNLSRKVHSYSQPLTRDSSSSKRAVNRKHSLDELINPFCPNPSTVDSSLDGRSLSYPHYLISASDIRLQHPHLPPPLPPIYRSGSSISEGDGTLTLERAMSEFGGAPGTLPEFKGNGGGAGIFRLPFRAAVHPGRPPGIEIRPHPLRETQAGSFLRTMVCTGNQLWAGQEAGLRFWNLDDLHECWDGRMAKRGDEASAPFYESGRTSPVVCLVADAASGFVWSGHKDGRIRSWVIGKERMESFCGGDGGEEDKGFLENSIGAGSGDFESLFREGLSWQAHRTPVLSMIITSYGNLTLRLSTSVWFFFLGSCYVW